MGRIRAGNKEVRCGKRKRTKDSDPHHWYIAIRTVGKAAVVAVPAIIKMIRR